MKKTHKAVLSTLAVLCLLFMGSGVAQAQQCIARSDSPGTVRAEGITEVVANIELKCKLPEETFGFNQVPERLDIAIELNARITNGISETRLVEVTSDGEDTADVLGYKSRKISLTAFQLATGTTGDLAMDSPIPDSVFQGVNDVGMEMGDMGGGKLSENSRTIVWVNVATGQDGPVAFTPPDATLQLGDMGNGFSLVIAGLRVNASSLGDGEDITAIVMVKGSAVGNPVTVAKVATGLAIKAKKVASGFQCAAINAVAMITIQEGYAAGIISGTKAVTAVMADNTVNPPIAEVMPVTRVARDAVLVSFRGIPEGVSVMVPDAVGVAADVAGTSADEMIESFSLALMKSGRDTGIDGKVADGKAKVMLSAAGNGSVVYHIFDASDMVDANEWANLPVTFQWAAGGDMPALGSSYVNVSFNPVSAIGGDSFADNGGQTPRFIATSGDPIMVLKIADCTTTLLFPFVTNQQGFETGLAISNTSEETGSCTITYSGANAPEPQTTQAVAGGAQWVNLASAISPGFQGYLTAACGFQGAHGFAFLSNGYPAGPPTAAQGYLAVCMKGASCD